MLRRLLPVLTTGAVITALLPAAPALADDLTVTIERGGVTLQFVRSATTEAWPVPLDTTRDPEAARFDIDGDGVDELIMGVQLRASYTSAVLVRYADGRVERLVDQRNGPDLGYASAVGDFNGDGFGDLALTAGATLWVLGGSAAGLDPASAIRVTGPSMPQDTSTLTGTANTALAAGDVDGDGNDDLAVGQSSQRVVVLHGATGGLTTTGYQSISSTQVAPPWSPAVSDNFGTSVALGDVTGDARPDLVVGAPGVGDRSGAVTVIPGTATGPTAAGATSVTGTQLDHIALQVRGLGARVRVAEVTGDGVADVVSDARDSQTAGRDASGVVVTLSGSAGGISAARRSLWTRNSAGVPGEAVAGEHFGAGFALAEVTGDDRPDLIAGVPAGIVPYGVADVVANSGAGLTGAGSVEIPPSTTGDSLGGDVQALELSGGGRRELALAGINMTRLYRSTATGFVAAGAVSPATFGAESLRVIGIGTTAHLPTGVALPVPAAGPAVPPVVAPIRQPGSRFDFDGDGRDEEVAGYAAGAYVRYSGGRVDQLRPRRASSGVALSFAAGDFNQDGYADLATGDRAENRDKPSITGQGGVWITYGGAGGLDYDGSRLITQDTAGVLDSSEAGDQFGAAVATGDINGDGFADLAVGAPAEDTGVGTDAGAVTVLYGSAAGITTTGSAFFSQRDDWVPDAEENGDRFGAALAIGDVTGDRRGDVAVASPGEDGALGSVTLVKGSGGLSQTGVDRIVYSELQRPTTTGAALGTALAVADLNRDGLAEVVAGAPVATAGSVTSAGLVVAFTGSTTGISRSVFRIVHQDTVGAPGAAESGDAFGASLATGDVNADGYTDLLVGSPDEATGSLALAGMANLFPGSAAGVTGTGGAGWDQNSPGMPAPATSSNRFGKSVSVLNLDATAGQDALIGSPGERSVANDATITGSMIRLRSNGTVPVPLDAWNVSSFRATFGQLGGLRLGDAVLSR